MPDVPSYRLCRQTVTLYHADPAARAVVRTVVRGVFFDVRRRGIQDKAGAQEGSGFLLILPQASARLGADYTLVPGDRVLPGEGPAVPYAQWPAFLPAAVPGLCTVRYVDAKTRGGVPCHVEAGGDWTAGGAGARSLTG